MSTVIILADFQGGTATKTSAELATVGARMGDVCAVVMAPVGQGAAMAATLNQGPISSIAIVEANDFTQHGVAAVA